jgi:hypothetical protein
MKSLLVSIAALCSCPQAEVKVVSRGSQAPAQAVASIDGILDALYGAVSFGPGEEGDWELVRSLFIDGAVFVQPAPAGGKRTVWNTEEFIQDFKDFIATSRAKDEGFNERITHRRTDVFGTIAHAYVVFEGRYGPTVEAKSRGLDSIQLVQDGGRWWVVSITTEFERPQRPLPGRFLVGGAVVDGVEDGQ